MSGAPVDTKSSVIIVRRAEIEVLGEVLQDERSLETHPRRRCEGRPCVVHAPTIHALRDFRLSWREDRQIFERICTHGVGHPDPDSMWFWRELERSRDWPGFAAGQAVHGCDGCCHSEVVLRELFT